MNKYDEYFKILDINKTNDLSIIKRAYRALSLKYHPDKNGDSNIFNNITNAYTILLNNIDNIELTNDNIIDNSLISKECNKTNINDSINTVNNINITINLSYIQVYTGCCIPVTITRNININNTITNEIETIYIDIPKGTDNDEIIIIKNKGNIIDNKQSDIKLYIKLDNHDIFTRSGLDIIYNKTITLKESLIGFIYNFTHINNKTYKIKSTNIIKDKHKELITGLGFTRNNYTGNLYIIYTIEYPSKISDSLIESIKLLM